MSAVDVEKHLNALEDSTLPPDTREFACDSMCFAQGFHELLTDIGILSNPDLDFAEMENALTSFFGELSAAGIFLSSYKNSDVNLMDTYQSLSKDPGDVPPILINGYKKLAERVAKTKGMILSSKEPTALDP